MMSTPLKYRTRACMNRYFSEMEMLSKIPSGFLYLAVIYTIMQTIGISIMFSPTPQKLRELEVSFQFIYWIRTICKFTFPKN